MRNKKPELIAMFLLCLGLTGLYAQEAIPATGGEASGSGGSAGYSIGQVVYTTNTGTNGSVAQGVQQPYEISVVNGIEPAKDINLICTIYPNPTTDFLILKIEGEVQTQYIASLYDINGKLIENKKLTGNETTIPMVNLVPATYFLKVMQVKNSNSKDAMHCVSFKIIKN